MLAFTRSMTNLQAIVYVSTASELMTPAELEALVAEASQLNQQHAITGVLLYSEGNFMQYFEGRESDMRSTYQRIRASRRHRGLIELLNESITSRIFSEWQLGFSEATPSELQALSAAAWQAGEESSSGRPAGLRLLQVFWNSTHA